MTADYAQAVRDGQAWAALEDGQIVGFAVIIAQRGYLLLDNVAVLPAAQGRGIGARLLALAEEQARGLGLREIRLYTNEAMTENLAYYPRHGYAETRRVHGGDSGTGDDMAVAAHGVLIAGYEVQDRLSAELRRSGS
jgi:GNAT superfamily N-acetyltransferase